MASMQELYKQTDAKLCF